ncbi:MAG TPA: HD domain-containing protein [Chloroflexota bacterium]
MAEPGAYRDGIRESLPELALISDADLRDKVVEAWALALAETEWRSIDDIPGAGDWKAPPMKEGSQAHHLRATATMAVGLAKGLQQIFPVIEIDYDVLVAASLLHDVGKAFEMSPRNLARWKNNPTKTGLPAVRHPIYGVHIAMRAGLPEAVVHIVGAHSAHSEGQFVTPSLENILVQYADYVQWRMLDAAEMLTGRLFAR